MKELVADIERLGDLKILDLSATAELRGIRQPWKYDGYFYISPPDGVSAAELKRVLDAAHARGEIHFDYNAQSIIDVSHKPILSLDAFSERYFGDPSHGVIKIVAVARDKVADLLALADELKKPFDPLTFPRIDQVLLATFKPPAEGHETVVGLKPADDGWKEIAKLEDDLKVFLCETNMIRELSVVRHGVKGLTPEVMLVSTRETSDKGNAFLLALADFLKERDGVQVEPVIVAPEPLDEPATPSLFVRPRAPEEHQATSPSELYRTAMETLTDTLLTMKGFSGLESTKNGSSALLQFPAKGFLGLANPFGKREEGMLCMVYRGVRAIPMFSAGWALYYHFDKSTKLLSLRVSGENDKVPAEWKSLV